MSRRRRGARSEVWAKEGGPRGVVLSSPSPSLFPSPAVITRLRRSRAMSLLNGGHSERRARPERVLIEQLVSVQGPTGQATAAAVMQRILTEEQQGATPSRVAHSGHAPETTSLWAGCQLSFVGRRRRFGPFHPPPANAVGAGSAGLALIRAHLESSGHLAKSNLVLQGAWQKTELPATAQVRPDRCEAGEPS